MFKALSVFFGFALALALVTASFGDRAEAAVHRRAGKHAQRRVAHVKKHKAKRKPRKKSRKAHHAQAGHKRPAHVAKAPAARAQSGAEPLVLPSATKAPAAATAAAQNAISEIPPAFVPPARPLVLAPEADAG